MRFRVAVPVILSLLAACGDTAQASGPADARDPNAWVIGPVIRGKNYSVGMPLHPTPRRGGGFVIDLPRHPGSVHYVTFPHGSLAGKRRIVMRYRIEMPSGVRIEASTAPGSPGMITPYFQRRGDSWKGRGAFDGYRWYATFATHSNLTRGEHVIVAPLDGPWTGVNVSTARKNPREFEAAIAQADQVGFVMGGGDGYGHGAYATGPARLIVTDFRVE